MTTNTLVEPPPASSPAAGRADLRAQNIRDAVIRLAGNSQDGIQSAGALLARLAGRSDQEVMTYMTIPSTISGGPSIFQVRIGTGDVLSAGDEADFLVAFYQHSYEDHIDFLKEGGVLLYDSDNVQPNLDDKRFVYVGIPITGLTVEALGGTAKDKGKNIFILGLIAKIFDLDTVKLTGAAQGKIRRQEREHPQHRPDGLPGRLRLSGRQCADHSLHVRGRQAPTGGPIQVTMDGNQALAYGLIAAGVRYGAAIPSPHGPPSWRSCAANSPSTAASSSSARMNWPRSRWRSASPTRGISPSPAAPGPGISLKTEAIGWAVMAEIPLIVVNVQRGGPSTGLPTNVEQSDLYQAIFGGHGDSPARRARPFDRRGLFLHRHRGGAHRAQVQHAGLHPQRLPRWPPASRRSTSRTSRT